MLDLPILSISICLPLFSALYITFFVSLGKSDENKKLHAIYIAILSSIMTLIVTSFMLFSFDKNVKTFQFVEKKIWIDKIGLEFYLGVDGLSIFFIFLTAFLTLICIISSIFTVKKHIKEFLLCFLLLESFAIGVFASLNMLLFYVFFEVILIPMYLIIGIWGGENRVYAALKFFLYTFFGSVFLLLALFYIFNQFKTFSIPELYLLLPTISPATQKILWLAMFLSFAVKVPMPPFHTWLPDAHVQAPTAGSVMLAGILLKLGGYAIIRMLLPMLPDACIAFAPYILAISAFTIIYASLVALAQEDMKKMIAYASVAHMGFVTGGTFSFTIYGLSGAIFQMISHGVISSALFLVVGMLYERHHTKIIKEYGGVANIMPRFAVLFMIAMLGSIGLPGTSGFVGEFLSIGGMYQANKIVGSLAAFGVVLGAIYMLKLYKEVMFGEVKNEKILHFQDITIYEKVSLVPLIILIIYIGIVPDDILSVINVPSEEIINLYRNKV